MKSIWIQIQIIEVLHIMVVNNKSICYLKTLDVGYNAIQILLLTQNCIDGENHVHDMLYVLSWADSRPLYNIIVHYITYFNDHTRNTIR